MFLNSSGGDVPAKSLKYKGAVGGDLAPLGGGLGGDVGVKSLKYNGKGDVSPLRPRFGAMYGLSLCFQVRKLGAIFGGDVPPKGGLLEPPDGGGDMPRSVGPPSAYSPTSYREAQAILDGVDDVARQMESKWGVGRLRLLVSDLTRARFDNQLAVWNDTIWNGDLHAVRETAGAMKRAWQFLDQEATQAGAAPLSPNVWEGVLGDGTVFAIARTNAEAYAAQTEGRAAVVYTVDELARIVEAERNAVVNAAKIAFPGAEVTQIRSARTPPPNDDVKDVFA